MWVVDEPEEGRTGRARWRIEVVAARRRTADGALSVWRRRTSWPIETLFKKDPRVQ